jgi:hypothetical protein
MNIEFAAFAVGSGACHKSGDEMRQLVRSRALAKMVDGEEDVEAVADGRQRVRTPLLFGVETGERIVEGCSDACAQQETSNASMFVCHAMMKDSSYSGRPRHAFMLLRRISSCFK